MIKDYTIQNVREIDILTLLKPYVELKRYGSSFMGICPFHSERTGSFHVTPEKNVYHCFSCGRGGDGISFVMEKENLTFMEAVEKIANDNNIPIEHTDQTFTTEELETYIHR